MAHISSCPSLAYIYLYHSLVLSFIQVHEITYFHHTLCLLKYTSAVFSSLAPTETPAGPSLYIACSFTAGDMPAGNCLWPHCGRAFVYFISCALVGGQLHPASSNWDIADVPYIFRRRNSPDISAHVQQPSLLNIDMHSTIREQPVQISNIISTDKYNPVSGLYTKHM